MMTTPTEFLTGRLTVREAARRCGRTPETIRRWAGAGRVPAEKIGGQLYVRSADLPGASPDPTAGHQRAVLDHLDRLREATRRASGSVSVTDLLDRARRPGW